MLMDGTWTKLKSQGARQGHFFSKIVCVIYVVLITLMFVQGQIILVNLVLISYLMLLTAETDVLHLCVVIIQMKQRL